MATEQYLRKASLLIGDDAEALDLSALRFRFAIHRGDTETPNTMDVRVYNVSDETAQKVQQEFTRVVLQAGYEGNFGLLFDGTVKQVRRGRESQTDTYLDITVADGDSAYNFAVMNTSLAAGASMDNQIAAAMQAMLPHGVSLGYKPFMSPNKLPRGKVFYGMARSYLSDMMRTAAAKWSIQDGAVNIVPLDGYVPGEPVVVTAATGMVGLPEQTQNGIRVRMLLNPSIKIGSLIKLDNASIQGYRFSLGISATASNLNTANVIKTDSDGLYYAMVNDHYGDTRGNEWYTETICLAVDASVPQGLLSQAAAAPTGPIKPYG